MLHNRVVIVQSLDLFIAQWIRSTYTLYVFIILTINSFNVGKSCTFVSNPCHKAAPLYKELFRYLLVHLGYRLLNDFLNPDGILYVLL